MANSSTNFIKINNEYVKFYATTNSSLPDILKNTGALIVVQNNDKESEDHDHLRSIYLANNFVAEGHGFSSYAVRDYYDSYAAIDETTGKRELSKILDNLKSGISENAYNFNKYVLTIGGDITQTNILAYVQGSEDGVILESRYLTNILKPAEYKSEYIYDVVSYVEYDFINTYVSNKFSKTSFVSYATNIDKLGFNNLTETRDIIYDVPRGAEIKNSYISLKTINNSCNGFTANSLENNSSEIPHTENSIFINNIATDNKEYRFVYDNETSNTFRDSTFFNAHSYGTTVYKKYPNLPSDINFISYENVINEYTTTLGYIKCNVYDVVRYGKHDKNNRTALNKLYGGGRFSRIYDTDNRYSYALLDNFDDFENDNYTHFSIPTNYEIDAIYQKRQYTRNGRLAYYEYNVSGDVFEVTYNNNKQITYISPISDSINKSVFINCKNYALKNTVKPNDSILILMTKNDIDPLEYPSITVDDYSKTAGTIVDVSNYFIQNSEYNSTHWFAYTDLKYIENTI